MKIQCDVCENQEASVFCTADEAALCEMCDNKVHHANKLASKHLRFSLHHPSFKEAPLCDICQEKRAFLFCKEDRAILCRECDIPIHKSNEHTQNHNRYILTGVKISNSLATYPNTSNLSSSDNSSSPNFISHTKISSITNVSSEHNTFNQHSYNSNNTSMNTISTPSSSTMNYNPIYEEGSISTSNMIPENLMENLPGWRLEDLLDSSSACFNLDF